MESYFHNIRNVIIEAISFGRKKFVIYPYGENGVMTKQILNDSFGINEEFIIDNKLSQFNDNIKRLDYCKNLDTSQYTILYTCAHIELYDVLLDNLYEYFSKDNIIKIFDVKKEEKKKQGKYSSKYGTQCGKYSYGSLCDHWLVKSVGAFCSFAYGSDVVENHAINYISTHPFLYYGGVTDTIHGRSWNEVEGERGYFSGVIPKGENYRLKKITIGNDVWLGRNVLIANSANIGNGVIAGAGAVITKDVPDYAVVVGVPARIIRYRYTKEEIEAMNRIAWWDWTDEKIRESYDDFYLSIKEFIAKYDV